MNEMHVKISVRMPDGEWRTLWNFEGVSQVCVDGLSNEPIHAVLGASGACPEVLINPGWPGGEGDES